MNEEPCIDPAALARLRRIGGEPLLREMLDLFLKHTPEWMQGARSAAEAGRLATSNPPREDALEFYVHKLRSSSSNMGAFAVRDLAGQIEELAGREDPHAVRLLADLELAYAAAKRELEEQRKKMPS